MSWEGAERLMGQARDVEGLGGVFGDVVPDRPDRQPGSGAGQPGTAGNWLGVDLGAEPQGERGPSGVIVRADGDGHGGGMGDGVAQQGGGEPGGGGRHDRSLPRAPGRIMGICAGSSEQSSA
jgi:hypothetical protein